MFRLVTRSASCGGETIIGQFSNLKLAAHTADEHRGAVVLDMSAKPPKVLYRDDKLRDEGEK